MNASDQKTDLRPRITMRSKERRKERVNIANMLTVSRMIISIILLFLPPLSLPFRILYLAAGISDMTDGTVARRTGTASQFGASLDTAADVCFVCVCLIKILPIFKIHIWAIAWTSAILMIKLIGAAWCYKESHTFYSCHSVLNKVTGCLLFAGPLIWSRIDQLQYVIIVCAVATLSALHEACEIRKNIRKRQNREAEKQN